MKLFLGEYDHTLDDRGRVTIPRKIRAELEDREIILSRGFEACIFGYEKAFWEKEAARHLDISVTDEKSRYMRRFLFAAAEKVEIDKLGRILLPALLKEYASIAETVVVVGAGDHFEIWSDKMWKEYSAKLTNI